MMKHVLAAGVLLAIAGSGWAQDLNFGGLNQGNTAAVAPAPITAPPAAADGQGAPYWGYNQYEYGRWNNGYYNRYNELKRRYDYVHGQIRTMRGWYSWGSYQRQAYDTQEDYGERLWRQYSRYQDQNSAWALETWLQQWEQYLAQQQYSGGWYSNNNGSYNDGWDYNYGYNNYYNNNRYQLPSYGYYDNYPRYYYGNNYYYSSDRAYLDGLTLGNGIGNIIGGSRYDNNLQLTGGILSTIGGTLGIINDVR